jgi:hypothetical protein
MKMGQVSTITFFLCLAGLAILIFGLSRASVWMEQWGADKLKVRAETMTAYATLAAAIAAFLSAVAAFLAVTAAEHQEKAMFTSALYGKQVDATANIVTKLESFARAFPSLGPRFTIDYHIHATDADFQKAYVDYQEAFYAINNMNIVYPAAAHSIFQVVKDISVMSFQRIKELQNIENNSSLETLNDTQATKVSNILTTLYNDLFAVAIKIQDCAMEQLREGRYIDGLKFQECSKFLPIDYNTLRN